jgi:hypothetical protein
MSLASNVGSVKSYHIRRRLCFEIVPDGLKFWHRWGKPKVEIRNPTAVFMLREAFGEPGSDIPGIQN